MLVVFKPQDPSKSGDPGQWTVDLRDVYEDEAEAVQRYYAGTWGEFGQALQNGDVKARKVLFWFVQWRDQPALKLADLPRYRLSELDIVYTQSEIDGIEAELLAAGYDQATEKALMVMIEKQREESRKALGERDPVLPVDERGGADESGKGEPDTGN